MTKALSLFVPYVLPALPGCSPLLARRAILHACIDFCKQTDAVQKVLTSQDVVATQQDYAVTPPAVSILVRVLGVSWRGVWLDPVAPADVMSGTALTGADIGTDALVERGSPRAFFQKTPEVSTISLHPVPDTALVAGLTIKASFAPTVAATVVDDLLYDNWIDTIAAGAIARLRATPHQPFSGDPSTHAKVYAAGVSAAKHQVFQGKAVSAARVRPRRFV